MLPLSPLISSALWFLRPPASRDPSSVPMAPLSNSMVAAKASSTSTLPMPLPSGIGRSPMKVLVSAQTLLIREPSR
jgi:hypothetical protein